MSLSAAPEQIVRPAHSPDIGAADVVYCFSNVTWQAAWRRGFFMPEDRLVRSLLGSKRVGRILVCNHARSLPVKLGRDLMGSDRVPFPTDARTHLIEPLRLLRRRDPAAIRQLERAFAAYDRALGRAVRRHGLENPVVISGSPFVAGFAPLPWARTVTWYAIDDWAEHPAYRRWWPAYRECYARMRRNGRRVAAVSSTLLDRLAPSGPGLVVPNGIDPAEWTSPCAAAPAWAAELPRPLFIYVGALDSRLDVAWLRDLAGAEPDAAIALVGPLVEPDHFVDLRGLANVHFHEPVGRRELTGLVRCADVGLLPHVSSRLTEAMSPLKLLEYLAAGLPVVATDLAPVRELGERRVIRVPPGGDFTTAARAALAGGPASNGERRAFLEGNSWSTRHERVLDLALS